MQGQGAVLDACVLFPLMLRDTLLDVAAAGLYLPVWSADLLEEVRRNLVADRNVSEEKAAGLVDEMRTHFPSAEVVHTHIVVDQVAIHRKDRHVLAVAIAAEARLVVTENLRHFPAATTRPYGVEARSPDDFLVDLYEADQARMVQVLIEQAERYRHPPKSLDELLAHLAKHTPQFAERVTDDVVLDAL